MNKKNYTKWWVLWIVVIVFAGGWFLFGSKKNPSYDFDKQQSDLYQQALNDWVEKQKKDTYGGNTPQETWNMFIDALEKGDVELASKYFVVGKQDAWIANLKNIKKNNQLDFMISDLSENYKLTGYTKANDFRYVKKDDGIVIAEVVLVLNEYTNKWKIESL